MYPSDWVNVVLDHPIPFEPGITKLLVKTDSILGSNEEIRLQFLEEKDSPSGGIRIMFYPELKYVIGSCTTEWKRFAREPPTETTKKWEFALNPRRINVVCNGKEVLDFVLSNTDCPDLNWVNGETELKAVRFHTDEASDVFLVKRGLLEFDCFSVKFHYLMDFILSLSSAIKNKSCHC